MHVSNYEPRRSWARSHAAVGWLDEVDEGVCLSCGAPWERGAFCRDCLERSRQSSLSPEWDDLGVGD